MFGFEHIVVSVGNMAAYRILKECEIGPVLLVEMDPVIRYVLES